jgi:hypothetical protein
MVLNLTSSDPYIKEQAEQFICVVCKKFPVPDFVLGKEGIKKESVRICQCNFCSGLACWSCWKKNGIKKDPICPKCRFRVEVPQDLYLDKDADTKVVQYLGVLKQKLLLNFIFNQTIIHRCKILEKNAHENARLMYDGQIK